MAQNFIISRNTRFTQLFKVLQNQQENEYFYVHSGKKYNSFVHINESIPLLNHNVGEFYFTKKLGRRIHNTERNKKRREKRLGKSKKK